MNNYPMMSCSYCLRYPRNEDVINDKNIIINNEQTLSHGNAQSKYANVIKATRLITSFV